MAYEFADAAAHWQTEGWALVEGLIPEAEIDELAEELGHLYGADTFRNYNGMKDYGDGTPTGKQFRGSQFDGMRGFPFVGCPKLNELFFHPRLHTFVRAALGDDDVRIYGASVWGKWAGEVNYEQPIHQDGNHSLLPGRFEPGYWNLETFLYLSDVDEDCAPPHVVPRSRSDCDYDELYAREVAATGKRGSLFAYRSDVWHRGTDFLRPDASRFVAVINFRPARAHWFSYDAFGRLGNHATWLEVVRGKTPDQLSLFGFPLPGDEYWTEVTVDGLAAKYPGLDVSPWRAALADDPQPMLEE